jgi:hypothetical protein
VLLYSVKGIVVRRILLFISKPSHDRSLFFMVLKFTLLSCIFLLMILLVIIIIQTIERVGTK